LDLKTGNERWKFKNPENKVGFNAALGYHDGLIYVGDIEGNFYCLDATNGKKKWVAKAEAEINSAANFYQTNVLFGSQDGGLYWLAAKAGEEKWKSPIGNQVRCCPTIVGDRSFTAGGDGRLQVVDLKTGGEAGPIKIAPPPGSPPAATG